MCFYSLQTSSPQRSAESPSRKESVARKPVSAGSALRERINKELAEKENKKAQDALVAKRDSDGKLNFSLRSSGTSSPDKMSKTSPIHITSPQRKNSSHDIQDFSLNEKSFSRSTSKSPRKNIASSIEQKVISSPSRNSLSPALKRTSNSSSPFAKKLSMTPPDGKKRLVNGVLSGSSSSGSSTSKKAVFKNLLW